MLNRFTSPDGTATSFTRVAPVPRRTSIFGMGMPELASRTTPLTDAESCAVVCANADMQIKEQSRQSYAQSSAATFTSADAEPPSGTLTSVARVTLACHKRLIWPGSIVTSS